MTGEQERPIDWQAFGTEMERVSALLPGCSLTCRTCAYAQGCKLYVSPTEPSQGVMPCQIALQLARGGA